MKITIKQKSERRYKDTLFRKLFGDTKNFLELYNAVADTYFPDDTVITPCPSNELLARFNDLAAFIGNQLIVFFEHQSSMSINMPLRLLSYITDILYSQITNTDSLYSNTQIKIPTPKFYVLFNGKQRLGNRVLKLSDAFIIRESEPSMELIAHVIDIKLNSGEEALNRSSTLQGYSFLIEEIRKNQMLGMTRDKSIKAAIDKCIETDVLKAFLTENYLEVTKMLNWEYNADAEKRVIKKEAEQQGLQRGRQQGLQRGRQQGRQQGAELLAKFVKDGIPLDVALEKIKSEKSAYNN